MGRCSQFQHTAARRRLELQFDRTFVFVMFQHTAARRRLADSLLVVRQVTKFQHTAARRRLGILPISAADGTFGFNTQPPEGGWEFWRVRDLFNQKFQHTAARRRLGDRLVSQNGCGISRFQHTAARRRLASPNTMQRQNKLFQHTAARRRLVSSNSLALSNSGFNTQPPEGGWVTISTFRFASIGFQHTAARRRLGLN